MNYQIELSEQELNTVLNALGQQPFVQVQSIIQNIMGQAQQAQNDATSEPGEK